METMSRKERRKKETNIVVVYQIETMLFDSVVCQRQSIEGGHPLLGSSLGDRSGPMMHAIGASALSSHYVRQPVEDRRLQ